MELEIAWLLKGRKVQCLGPDFAGIGNGSNVYDRSIRREHSNPFGPRWIQ
jgi:hypothetical protein